MKRSLPCSFFRATRQTQSFIQSYPPEIVETSGFGLDLYVSFLCFTSPVKGSPSGNLERDNHHGKNR